PATDIHTRSLHDALPISIGEQHDFASTVGNRSSDQGVALFQAKRNQTDTAWTTKLRQRSFLHCTLGRCHKDVSAGRLVCRLVGLDRKSTRLNSSHVKISY